MSTPAAMGTPGLVTLVTLVTGGELAALAAFTLAALMLAVKRGWVRLSVSFAVIPMDKRARRPAPSPDPPGLAADDEAPASPGVPARALRDVA